MSSFGSNGSRGGAGAESAARTSITPYPVSLLTPGSRRLAVRRTSVISCVLSSSGRRVQIHASAPDTSAAA
jgi:hypothetical protein